MKRSWTSAFEQSAFEQIEKPPEVRKKLFVSRTSYSLRTKKSNAVNRRPSIYLWEVGCGAFAFNSPITLPGLPELAEEEETSVEKAWSDKELGGELEALYGKAEELSFSASSVDGGPLRTRSLAPIVFSVDVMRKVGWTLMVAAHSDGKESKGLAALRGLNFASLLNLDRDLWTKTCMSSPRLDADIQEILRCFSDRHSWPCDPGAVDGEWSGRTKSALAGFQRAYEDVFDRKLSWNSAGDLFAAFFDVYVLELDLFFQAQGVKLEAAGVSTAILDCAAEAPLDSKRTAFQDTADRRVEILCVPTKSRYDVDARAELYKALQKDIILLSPLRGEEIPIAMHVQSKLTIHEPEEEDPGVSSRGQRDRRRAGNQPRQTAGPRGGRNLRG